MTSWSLVDWPEVAASASPPAEPGQATAGASSGGWSHISPPDPAGYGARKRGRGASHGRLRALRDRAIARAGSRRAHVAAGDDDDGGAMRSATVAGARSTSGRRGSQSQTPCASRSGTWSMGIAHVPFASAAEAAASAPAGRDHADARPLADGLASDEECRGAWASRPREGRDRGHGRWAAAAGRRAPSCRNGRRR